MKITTFIKFSKGKVNKECNLKQARDMKINHFLKQISVLLGISVVFSIMLTGVFEAQAEEYEVVIPRGAFSPQCVNADTCFVPSSLQIPVNGTVEWENKDNAPHTIVSGNGQSDSFGLFSSGVLNYNDEFYVDFSDLGQGTYPYYCSIHPWMKGEIIVGDAMISEPTPQPESEDKIKDETTIIESDSKYEPIMEHTTPHHSSERNLEDYSLRLDWIQEFPVTGQVNGFELIVTDSSKKGMMMSGGGCGGGHGDKTSDHSSHDDKGMKEKMSKHGDSDGHSSHDKGMKGMSCGGGSHGDDSSAHSDKGMSCGGGSHGDKTSDHSSHDDKGMKEKMSKHGDFDGHSSHDKGMGGHEGGCPHFKMVKQSIPKVAALEAGVEGLENSLNMEIIVLGNSYPVAINEDDNFNGRYYVLFVPTIAAQYDVHVSGVIGNQNIDVQFSPSRVIDRSLIQQIP